MATTIKSVDPAWLQQADQIRENLDGLAKRIGDDPRLSDAAKRTRTARLYLQAKEQMDQLTAGHAKAAAEHRLKLTRKAFGFDDVSGFGAMDRATVAASYRDAQDRVAKITEPREAQALLDRAERGGDELLSRAVAAHAAESGWADVLGAYTQTRPGQAAAIDQLQQAQAEGGTRSLFAWVVPMPSALSGYESRLQALADAPGMADPPARP
ncbi:MAG: hypothetical protein DLM59_18505 [Pseudonocardiales bacterium]|nr:MAG: hypothetical protein DLM59_18505 [Pseudonocardiales bacterium]